MEVNARISGAWRKRMLFLFFMIFGIGAWFLTDGYHYWPTEAARYAEYVEIKDALIEEGKAVDEESTSVRLGWKNHAEAKGYVNKVPKERTDSSIREQRTIGWVLVGGSLCFLAWILWNHTLCVKASGDIVIGTNGKEVSLDSITKIDRKKWDSKGIAYAIYSDGGKQYRLCLDDHKFEGCEAIILEAERRIKARKEASSEEA